jgi:hypothetical protein
MKVKDHEEYSNYILTWTEIIYWDDIQDILWYENI